MLNIGTTDLDSLAIISKSPDPQLKLVQRLLCKARRLIGCSPLAPSFNIRHKVVHFISHFFNLQNRISLVVSIEQSF